MANPLRHLSGQLGLPLGPTDHYDMLHANQRGVVLHWERQSSDNRWRKLAPNDPAIPDILQADLGRDDRFISVNEFDGWRLIRLLRSLRALYVDLDGQTDWGLVLDTLQTHRLPTPSAIVFSGRGLHLYWLLEPLPAQALPVWQRCQDHLIKMLKSVGADPAAKDCTRVLRLAGSRNHKNGEQVEAVILDGHRWQMRQLAWEILGADGRGQPPKARVHDLRAKRKVADKNIRGSIYARWHLVYRDLLRIAKHHGHQIPAGSRDKWLFLTSVALSWFTHPDGIATEIEGLADEYTDLPDHEVQHAFDASLKRALMAANGEKMIWRGMSIDPRYHFKRQTLYDWLDDLIPDSLLPRLRAVIHDDEAARRQAERQKARDRVKEGRYQAHYTKDGVRADRADLRVSARLLRAQGRSLRDIAAEIGVSADTIRRWTNSN